MFSLEIYCRTAKLQVDGLVALLRPAAADALPDGPELGPPDVERDRLPAPRTARGPRSGSTSGPRSRAGIALLGDLDSARLRVVLRRGRLRSNDLGRHPRLQRGGQRRARLRAPVGGVRRHARGLGADLQRRPLDRPHRGADPRAARARPAREDAALLAPLRPARRDAGRDGGRRRRRRRGDRLRPAGPAGADRRDGRALARGLRGRLRPAPHARGRDAGQARRLRGRLPRDQAHLRRRDPAPTPATSG